MNLDQTVTVSPDVMMQEVNGETVLLDLKSETYFGLNEVGTRIWQLITSGEGLSRTLEILLAEFDIDKPTLLTDFDRLLTELADQGLLILNSSTKTAPDIA